MTLWQKLQRKAFVATALTTVGTTGFLAKAQETTKVGGSNCPRVGGRPLKLVQVHTVFRHGSRTPMINMKGVFWSLAEQTKTDLALAPFQLWAFGRSNPVDFQMIPKNIGREDGPPLEGGAQSGSLTRNGMLMAIDLGKELRSRYVDEHAEESDSVRCGYLLPNQWSQSRRVLNIMSTKTSRTVETAQGLMTGMFPETVDDGIDIHLVGGNLSPNGKFLIGPEPGGEFMVFWPRGCDRLAYLFGMGKRLAAQHRAQSELDLLAHIEQHEEGWMQEDEYWKFISYRDQLSCREAEGKSVPAHIVDVAPSLDKAAQNQMEHIFEGGARFHKNAITSHSRRVETLRLGIGRLVTHLLERMDRPDSTMHLYSGHDWSVSPLFMCVAGPGATHDWPPFCSNISFEVWSDCAEDSAPVHWSVNGINPQNDDGRYVRVIYNSEVLKMPCGEVCKMKDFKRLMKPFLVKDYGQLCELKEGEYMDEQDFPVAKDTKAKNSATKITTGGAI
jgi:hypothetical protein